MLTQEKREVTERKLVTTAITCNKCGHNEEIDPNGFNYNLFQKVNFHFGYGSKFDTETWEFHLCDDCVVSVVKELKYAPLGFGDENLYGHNTANQDENQKYFEKWKSNQ